MIRQLFEGGVRRSDAVAGCRWSYILLTVKSRSVGKKYLLGIEGSASYTQEQIEESQAEMPPIDEKIDEKEENGLSAEEKEILLEALLNFYAELEDVAEEVKQEPDTDTRKDEIEWLRQELSGTKEMIAKLESKMSAQERQVPKRNHLRRIFE